MRCRVRGKCNLLYKPNASLGARLLARWDRDYRFSPGARLQNESARTREWLPLAFAIRRERGAASPNIVMARDASPARVRVRC